LPHFLDRIYYRGPRARISTARISSIPMATTIASSPARPHPADRAADLRRPDQPAWPDRVAVRPSKPVARVEGEAMRVTWIGHATVLVQADGLNILTDPVWSDTAGPFGFGPRRVAEPGVRFEDLPRIDLVLISHNHYDHMDLATLKRLWDRDGR
jgi:hypothetical protein